MGEDASTAVAYVTAFGGGFGRTDPKEDWDAPGLLALKIRQNLIDQFETAHCATLWERFGEERQMKACCQLVRTLASDLVELLTQESLSQKESG